MLVVFIGCGKGDLRKSDESTMKSIEQFAIGKIYISEGSKESIQEAIIEHTEIARKEVPREFDVKLSKLKTGGYLLEFPDGIVPYDLVNLIGWLDDPPGYSDISGSIGWLTSPSDGIRYTFETDRSNELRDTLIGVSSNNEFFSVYLPDASLRREPKVMNIKELPEILPEHVESSSSFSATFDVSPSFGNPAFIVTH